MWRRINCQTYYTVNFDTQSLIDAAVLELDNHLTVTEISITVTEGEMKEIKSKKQLQAGEAMKIKGATTTHVHELVNEHVKYDLIGKLVEATGLTRLAIVNILKRVKPTTFNKFKANPEEFIIRAGNIINQCKAIAVVEHVKYHKLDREFDADIFSAEALKGQLVKNGLYDIKIQHIQLEWIPKDAQIVVCHENLKGRIQARVPHAHIVTVTDFLHAPEYAKLSEELAAVAA